MATNSYEAGYKKCFGDRLANLSHATTEGEIKDVDDNWASKYDEVISNKLPVYGLNCVDLQYSEPPGMKR